MAMEVVHGFQELAGSGRVEKVLINSGDKGRPNSEGGELDYHK